MTTSAFVCLATPASPTAWLAVVVIGVVAFGVVFAGVVSSVGASATAGMLPPERVLTLN